MPNQILLFKSIIFDSSDQIYMSPTLNGASFHQKGFDLSKVQRIQSNHLLFSNPPIKSDISHVLPYFETLSLKWVSRESNASREYRASRGSIEFHLTIGWSGIPQSITLSIYPLEYFLILPLKAVSRESRRPESPESPKSISFSIFPLNIFWFCL